MFSGAMDCVGRRLHLFGLVMVVVAAVALAPAVACASSVDQSTAYQLDAAHDGYQTGPSISTPLTQLWSRNYVGAVSYPLIVNGVVYVTARGTGSGTTLYAAQQATGDTLWSQPLGTSSSSALTYDAGQVFTLDAGGTMTAFNAQTGTVSWSTSIPGEQLFSSAPTAFDGVVYTAGYGSDGDAVFAVSEATGSILWTQPVNGGDGSSPAVDSAGVYVTYECGEDYDFSPLSGMLIWHDSIGCNGGSGRTPVLANGTIFGRSASTRGDLILSAAGGGQLTTFSSTTPPAVGGGLAYTLAGGTLNILSSSGQGPSIATFTGDGQLDTAPVVADGVLLEGSGSGTLYALDPTNGAIEWSGTVGSFVSGANDGSLALSGLGVGENTIVVPVNTQLVVLTGANVGTGTPSNTLGPSVTGTPVAGQAIGADVGVWSALPTQYSYQWYLCDGSGAGCSAIAAATSEAYTPTVADIGDTLKVEVGASNGSGPGASVSSAASPAVIPTPAPPSSVTAPTITGTATIGQTLTVSNGVWTNNPMSFQYQWLDCNGSFCSAITGATNSTFTVTSSYAGDTLEAQVFAGNAIGASVPATSAQTSTVPIPTSLTLTPSANPISSGTLLEFTAVPTPVVAGGTISFYADGQPITGCTGERMSVSLSAICLLPGLSAGTWAITVQYSGYGAYTTASASLVENVTETNTNSTTTSTSTPTTSTTTPTTSTPTTTTATPSGANAPGPPSEHVGEAGPKDKPNFTLRLLAVRTSAPPYRYWFALKSVKCTNRGSAVLVTIGKTTVRDECGPKLELASKTVTAHRYYNLILRPVRYGKDNTIAARGPAYHERLYMPGNEVTWTPQGELFGR